MPLRSTEQPFQQLPELSSRAVREPGEQRATGLDPAALRTRSFAFLAQLALPGTEAGHVIVKDGETGGPMYFCLTDPRSQAWARVGDSTTAYRPVTQGGDRYLWDELEAVHDLWKRLGQPRPEEYTITITPDGDQMVDLPGADRSWVSAADQVRRYAWADEDTDMAWTLAVVTGRSSDAVIRAYGGDPTHPAETLPFARAHVPPDELGTYSLVQIKNAAGFIVAIENNGWRGKDTGVAEHASQDGGSFLSVFWNLNANYKLTQARDSKLLASFDPLTVQHPAPVGETYPDWIMDVMFTDDNLHAVLLAVIERQTGLSFDPTWLTHPLPTYRIPA